MDAGSYAKFILALVFVLGLIGLLAAVVRRYGLGMPQTQIRRAKDKRLGLIEVMPLDAKRRLVLIKRDQAEHLVILGPNSETVVESNIAPLLDEPSEQADFAQTLANTEDAPETKEGDA